MIFYNIHQKTPLAAFPKTLNFSAGKTWSSSLNSAVSNELRKIWTSHTYYVMEEKNEKRYCQFHKPQNNHRTLQEASWPKKHEYFAIFPRMFISYELLNINISTRI